MQYMTRICNNVIVNMYLAESNMQDVRCKCSDNELRVKSDWFKLNEKVTVCETLVNSS